MKMSHGGGSEGEICGTYEAERNFRREDFFLTLRNLRKIDEVQKILGLNSYQSGWEAPGNKFQPGCPAIILSA